MSVADWHADDLAAWDAAFERATGKRVSLTPMLHRCETPYEVYRREMLTRRVVRLAPRLPTAMLYDGHPFDPCVGRGDRETVA